jgi:hypothetical protein
MMFYECTKNYIFLLFIVSVLFCSCAAVETITIVAPVVVGIKTIDVYFNPCVLKTVFSRREK